MHNLRSRRRRGCGGVGGVEVSGRTGPPQGTTVVTLLERLYEKYVKGDVCIHENLKKRESMRTGIT